MCAVFCYWSWLVFCACYPCWLPVHHIIKREIRSKFLFRTCSFISLFLVFYTESTLNFQLNGYNFIWSIGRCSRWYICSLWGLPTIIIIISFLDGCIQKGVWLYCVIETHWRKIEFHHFLIILWANHALWHDTLLDLYDRSVMMLPISQAMPSRIQWMSWNNFSINLLFSAE